MALLEEHGVDFDRIEYLETPPSRDELAALLEKLPGEASEYYRRDAHWKSLEREEADYLDSEQVIALLLEHPRLLERPIAVRGDRAVVGRPPENVLALLD